MVYTLAVTNSFEIKQNISLEELNSKDILWFWVDFDCPNNEESRLLETHFKFHHLAIEDCLHFLQRPKVDFYDGYNFFVLHALNKETLKAEELDLFVGDNFIVSFHSTTLTEIAEVKEKLLSSYRNWSEINPYMVHLVIDKLVNHYFPAVHKIEDCINALDENENNKSTKYLMAELFEVRSKLLKIRRIVVQMRDLMYRILNSDHLVSLKKKHRYFSDIYDHLLKLSEMIDSNGDITSEMRENYLSINSHRMNTNMMLLTVITSIFIPLTFIAGIYGMNFDYMPELKWKYGYFFSLVLMGVIAIVMYYWFKKRGWFDVYK